MIGFARGAVDNKARTREEKALPFNTYLFSVRPVLPRSVHDHRRLKEGLLAIYTYQVRFFEISAEFMTAVRTNTKKA